jgi:hypothetical protein
VLGFLCTAVGGEHFSAQLAKRVFAPAGMGTARPISESAIIPNRSAGYQLENGDLRNQSWIAPSLNTTGDGSLYMSVRDLAAWDASLYSDSILSEASKQAMWTATKLADGSVHPYGFGWRVTQTNGRRTVKHSGDWQGYSAHISRYLDDALTVIVMTNLTGADPERIVSRIAAIYEPALSFSRRVVIADTAPKLTANLRDVLGRIADGSISREPFTAKGQARLFPDRIKEAQELFASLGPIVSIEILERRSAVSGLQTSYRISYEKKTLTLDVTTTADALIDSVTAEFE